MSCANWHTVVLSRTSRCVPDPSALFRQPTGPHLAVFILPTFGRWSSPRRSCANLRQNAITQTRTKRSGNDFAAVSLQRYAASLVAVTCNHLSPNRPNSRVGIAATMFVLRRSAASKRQAQAHGYCVRSTHDDCRARRSHHAIRGREVPISKAASRMCARRSAQRRSNIKTNLLVIRFAAPSPTTRTAPRRRGRRWTDPWIVSGRRRMARRTASARPTVGSRRHRSEGRRRQPRRRLRAHRPVRDEQRAGAGIEERARQPGQRLRAGPVARAVLQADSTTQSASSFNCATSDAVSSPSSTSLGCAGRRQRQRGLAQALDVARNQAVGREIHHSVAGERLALDVRLGRLLVEKDVAC